MRIVAGRFRGRPLAAPEGARTRPTSDRVREAMFNILEHGIAGFSLAGVRVLDLFAGTGALGLEALSRGAAFCLFVEEDAAARGLIRRNIEVLDLTGVTKVFRRDAAHLGAAGNRGGRLWLWSTEPPYPRLVTRDSRNSMIYDLDFAPDGKTLAVAIGQSGAESTSPAGTNPAATSAVKLFDLATHEFKTTLAVPTTAVRSIRFDPDGQSLHAACEDGKIQIWRAPNTSP